MFFEWKLYVVSHLMQVLGTIADSSARAARIPNHAAISPALKMTSAL